MRKLVIRKLEIISGLSDQACAKLLDEQTTANKIEQLNWKEYPYAPEVVFNVGHTDNEIWLKYHVREKYLRALETRTNGDVYKDSTVEFFIEVNAGNYYNLEINCIGTIHFSYGPGRGNRKRIDLEIVETIKVHTSLKKEPFEEREGDFEWDIFIRIPKTCFTLNKIENFKGLKARGNFYKCGDATKVPHYISWSPIKTEKPDYHRAEYFGELVFE